MAYSVVAVLAVLAVIAANTSAYKLVGNYDCAGHKYDVKHVKGNLAKCSAECDKLKSCQGIMMVPSKNYCFLKKENCFGRKHKLSIARLYKKVKPAPKKPKYTVSKTVVKGVFLVSKGRYTFSYGNALNACKAVGAKLASYGQLKVAYKAGMNVCNCGWTTDKKAHYPITQKKSMVKGCGGSWKGIRTCKWQKKWNAYCYKKPATRKPKCVKPCPKTLKPVCGTDGKTYSNTCGLKNAQCKNKKLRQRYNGKCIKYKTGKSVKGVFWLSKKRYSFTYAKAVAACKNVGAKLASYGQLKAAYKAGMNQCSCGWTTDKKAHYPITLKKSLTWQCGGSKRGIRTCKWQKTWDAYCYRA